MRLQPLSRPDMQARHVRAGATRRKLAQAANAQPKPPRNVEVVLDLGNRTYIHFRGRAYGVPPLPWPAGQALLAAWLEALQYPSPLTAETAPLYYRALAKIPPLLWANCYPANRFLRVFRFLLRNPFKTATEQEVVDHAGFFLERRMRSGVSAPPVQLGKRAEEMR